jgi:hypothetical protein
VTSTPPLPRRAMASPLGGGAGSGMAQLPPVSRRFAWRPPSPPVPRGQGATLASGFGRVYRPRRPPETPLCPVVQHHLETFLAEAQDADPMGWGVPTWVERDFRSYLRCGILAHGFARVRCTDCGHDRLLAFSCKGRGVCPSCNARRMAEVAAHLTDEVIPHLPVRQWVLSVPKRLRPFLHQTPEVASAVLAIFLRALRAALRDASPGAPDAVRDAQLGAISFPQRFGSSLPSKTLSIEDAKSPALPLPPAGPRWRGLRRRRARGPVP